MKILTLLHGLGSGALNFLQLFTAALVGLVMFTNIPLFADKLRFSTSSVAIAPYFDYLLIVLAICLFLLTWRQSIKYIFEPHFLWCIALISLYAFNVVRFVYFSSESTMDFAEDDIQRLRRSALLPVYGFLIYVLGRRYIQNFIILAVIFLIPFNFIDFLNPSLFVATSDEFDVYRSDSTYLNANIAGESMILVLLLLYGRLGSLPLAALFLFSGMSIITTFSRAAMGAWVLMLGVVMTTRKVTKTFWMMPLIFLMMYTTLITAADRFLYDLIPNQNQAEQLIGRLNYWGDISSDNSGLVNEEETRGELALATLEAAVNKPILGYVTSPEVDSGTASHNQLLEYWYIYGIFGVVVWCLTLYLMHRQSTKRILGFISPEALLFLWFSMFNHQLFTGAFWMIFYAMTMIRVDRKMSIAGSGARFDDFGVKRRRSRRRRKASSRRRTSKLE